jgi:hypothetical protein
MIAVAIALVSLFAAGLLIAIRLDPHAPRNMLVAEALLIGPALSASVLFTLSLLGIEWSLLMLATGVCIVTALVFGLMPSRQRTPGHWAEPATTSWTAHTIDALCLLLLVGYALFATAGPVAEYDFIGIWGVKGQEFHLHRGIDWEFLRDSRHVFTHADYPILLPLIYDALALASGGWRDDGSMNLVFVCFGAATLLMTRVTLGKETPPLVASLGTLALLPFALSPYIGIAEGPLVAYSVAGLLILRAAFAEGNRDRVALGAAFLGFAASTKNEGLTIVIAVLIASLAFVRERSILVRLWPAIVIPLPWQILRAWHGLSTDLTEGNFVQRIWIHLQDPVSFLAAMTRYPLGNPIFWLGLALALIVVFREVIRREKFLLAVVALQYVSYLLAYLSTPHDLDWHFKWSWERVINQMTVPLGIAIIAALGSVVADREKTRPLDTSK